jgi:hypothetical protein
MTHYVCDGGCGGSSDTATVCKTETCPKYQQPMKSCDCLDAEHLEVKMRAAQENHHKELHKD